MKSPISISGTFVVRLATLLSVVAVLLLIFVHVGQINTSKVPYEVSMVTLNVSGYGAALNQAFQDPIQSLYMSNASSSLGQGQGLRQIYRFGLYSYCGYVSGLGGSCSSTSAASRFQPFDAITADMLSNYTQFTNAIFTGTTFKDSSYLGSNSHTAYYFLLFGTIFASLALLCMPCAKAFDYVPPILLSFLSAIFLVVGVAIWTSLIKKVGEVNTMQISPGVSTGMTISPGIGISLSWAACACMAVSVTPWMAIYITYR